MSTPPTGDSGKPRISMLTRYAPLGASSRVRAYQFLPTLERAGFDARPEPLLGDDYVRELYRGRRSAGQVLRAYLGRCVRWRDWTSSDIVWVEKELLPFVPAGPELAMLGRRRLVLDLDDAIFHNYDLSRHALVRRLLGRKIDRLMQRADLVTAGNEYLAQRARAAGARRVEVLPSVIDLARYPRRPHAEPPESSPAVDASRTFTLVWIGSPATVHYLNLLRPALEQLAAELTLRLEVIGADAPQWPGVSTRSHAWSANTEAALIAAADVGIMPLADTPWEQGKCSFKLIQYMACGLPVVASPVGMNRDVVRPGHNGLLAADAGQWVQALRTLHAQPTLARQWGDAGRADVEQRFNLEVVGTRMVGLLHELLERS